MNTPEKDYSHRGWIAALALIAVLGAVSFIPPQSLGGVKLRRANILSDILSFEDAAAEAAEPALFDEDDFHVDMAQVARRIEAERIEADTAPRPVQTIFEWLLRQDSSGRRAVVPDTVRLNPALVAIEQFAPADSGRLRAFYDTLLYARRPVRIAVLGDSFIEGDVILGITGRKSRRLTDQVLSDILTADLREKLQQAYGGGGAGFAPMASPLTAFRRTIKTQSKGWTAYNIMQRKAAPQNLRGHFFVSGWVCQPSEGASTRWENTDYRQRLDSCTAARVFFISPGDVVDNYSVRSNNGQAMFWTNPSVNAQINAHAGYDLVILQYGLNIMQTGVHNYTNYARQIEKMVVYVQQCFPTAAVLVLGVSDRSVKTDAGFEPMDAIPYMLDYQRGAAENTGAAFWPTCDAMRSLGGMEQFVANGWAGKDYTHINYAGGRRVAWSLVDAINAGAYEAHAAAEAARIRRQAEQAVLDSVRLLKIDRELRPVSAIGNLNTPRK